MLPLSILQAGLVTLLASGPAPLQPIASVSQATLDDPTIVAIFDAANTYDMETSGLAEKRATHSDVKALGKQFAGDHARGRGFEPLIAHRSTESPAPSFGAGLLRGQKPSHKL